VAAVRVDIREEATGNIHNHCHLAGYRKHFYCCDLGYFLTNRHIAVIIVCICTRSKIGKRELLFAEEEPSSLPVSDQVPLLLATKQRRGRSE